MILENAVHPTLIWITDWTGVSWWVMPKSSGRKLIHFLGMAVKNINRQGLVGRYDLFGTQLVELTEDTEDYRDIRSELGYSKGKAWGYDVGIEQVLEGPGRKFIVGASYLNIGKMHFRREEGTGKIPNQDSSLNLGVSYSRDLPLLDYTLGPGL